MCIYILLYTCEWGPSPSPNMGLQYVGLQWSRRHWFIPTGFQHGEKKESKASKSPKLSCNDLPIPPAYYYVWYINSLWSTKFLCGSLVTATLHTFVDLVWTHYLETIGDTTIRRYIYLIYLDFTALHCGNALIHTLGPTLSESPSLSHPPQFQNVRVWGLLCAGEFVAGSPRSLQPGWVWE